MLKTSSASLLEIRRRRGVPSSWKSGPGLQDCKLELCPQGSFKSFCQTKPENWECFRMTGLERPSLSWDGRALDAHKRGGEGVVGGCWGNVRHLSFPLPPCLSPLLHLIFVALALLLFDSFPPLGLLSMYWPNFLYWPHFINWHNFLYWPPFPLYLSCLLIIFFLDKVLALNNVPSSNLLLAKLP